MYENMLKIPDTAKDSFWGVLAIIVAIEILYIILNSRIEQKKLKSVDTAKRICIEELNRRCALAGTSSANDEVSDDYEDYEDTFDNDEE